MTRRQARRQAQRITGPGVFVCDTEMDPDYDPPSTSLNPRASEPDRCQCDNCPNCGKPR